MSIMHRKFIHLVSCFIVLGLAGNVSAELIGHWELDDGSGAIAKDSAGVNDGTLIGDTGWTAGFIKGALEFDGDGDYVDCGNDEIFNPTGSFSITFWAFIRDWSFGWAHCMISKGGDQDRGGWSVRRFSDETINFTAADLVGDGSGNEGENHNINGTTPPSLNEWVHIACVYDVNNMAYIYINGEVDRERATTGTVAPTDASLYLGTRGNTAGDGPDGWSASFYNGLLDDVRFYDYALSEEEIAKLVVGEPKGPATNPGPVNGTTYLLRDDVILSWTPGPFADTHDVYFGTVFDDVNNADTSSPLLVSPAQDVNTYDPGRLEFGLTYFWRIDEVNAPPDSAVYKGSIWSFTVEPFAYPIPGQDITATASSFAEGQEPINTVNSSGLDADNLHSTDTGAMWRSAADDPGPVWIQYEFDKAYKLHEMLVWNYNGSSTIAWSGIKDVTVEHSIDGTNWTQLTSVTEFAEAPGEEGYAADTIVPFDDIAVKYVRIVPTSNWSSGNLADYGLSEVRFTAIPVSAREPNPASGAKGVAINVTLGWKAGREAAEHSVYFNADQQSVIDGTVPVDTVSQVNYSPLSLELGDTYFWRVDEVNNAETPTTWQSNTWSFSTQESLVVEDFETYNDIEQGEEGSNLVYDTWKDGFVESPAVPTNGSTIGYFIGASLETNIVHSGDQSVPLFYDNTSVSSSEVTVNPVDLAIGPDWSIRGAQTLVLWFYGNPDNSVTEQMYVSINGTKAAYTGDYDNLTRQRWTQWNIDLASLGVNQSNVSTFSIGFERTGATGGSGIVLIDDIRLYKSAPPVPVSTEPSTDGLVAYYTFENNAQDSSGNGLHGTIVGSPIYLESLAGFGIAMRFDGVDEYVDCGDNASFDVAEEITLSVWVNTYDAGNSQHNPFVGKGDESYAIKHAATNNIEFFIYDEEWQTLQFSVDDSFNGTWHHVAGTFDGSQLRLYVDGGLADSMGYTGSIASTTFPVNIGRNSQETDRFYRGVIDEVRIYNRALSEGEILYLADL